MIYPRARRQDSNPGFSDTQVYAISTGQHCLVTGGRGERVSVPEARGDGFQQQLFPLGGERDGLVGGEVWPLGHVSPGSLFSPSVAARAPEPLS